MKFRKLHLAGVLVTSASFSAGQTGAQTGPWISDPQHPELQHQFKCEKGSLTILWRNGYAGAVTLRAAVVSSTYDGLEDVQIPPGGKAESKPDTLYCSLGSLRVITKKFSLAAPPSPPPQKLDSAAKPPVPAREEPPPAPFVLKFDPPEKLPETPLNALAAITVGMKQEGVVQKLGPPLSKVSIPEDGQLTETYRYNTVNGKISIVRFSNGTVTEILPPQ
jgi:hypothetical protein